MKQLNHPSSHRANPKSFLRKQSENNEKIIFSARNNNNGKTIKQLNFHLQSSGEEEEEGSSPYKGVF